MSLARALTPAPDFHSDRFADVQGAGRPLLEVVEGVHAGVSIPFNGDVCIVGNSREADVILSDASVTDRHVRLRICGKMLAVDAIGGDVVVKGHSRLEAGRGCRVALPVEIGVGNARMLVRRPRTPISVLRRLAFLVGGVVIVLVVPLAAGKTILSERVGAEAVANNAPRSAPEQVAPIMSAPSQIAGIRPTHQLASERAPENVLTALQQKLASAKIDTISVAQDGGRHITALGSIDESRKVSWGGVQEWFDRTYGSRYVLTSAVSAAAIAKAPRFDFQAVWFGEDPYVIGGDGSRLYPGASIADGWSIKSIEKGRILVTRQGKEIALTL